MDGQWGQYVKELGVACTVEKCPRFFKTHEDMKKHKTADPYHHFCDKCDEDFDTRQELREHLVKNIHHSACPVCTKDFSDDSDRDSHLYQEHPDDTFFFCPGCREYFKGSGDLVRHVEDGKCPTIPAKLLAFEIGRSRHHWRASRNMPGSLFFPASTEKSGRGSPDFQAEEKRQHAGDARRATMNTLPWKTVSYYEEVPSPNIWNWNSPSTVDQSFQQGIKTSVFGKGKGKGKMRQSYRHGNTGPADMPNVERIRIQKPGLVIHKHTSSTGCRFFCDCGFVTTKPAKIQNHVNEAVRQARQANGHDCPCCGRSFRRPSELMAHIEANIRKCRVARSENFARYVHLASGGILVSDVNLRDEGIPVAAKLHELQARLGLDSNQLKGAEAYQRVKDGPSETHPQVAVW